jgi:flagellar hook-length control protein FliK
LANLNPSRDSSGSASVLTNPEAGQQAELNAARADFEQSLERVAESFPLDSVAQQIVEVAEPDSGWISVEIQPPELGKLEIMVSKQGDDYAARIVAHEASTEEALSLQQAELLEALNQHGLELKEIQIISDSDSGNRWNLDSSQQEQHHGQSEREYSGERQEDARAEYSPTDIPGSASKVGPQAVERQQVNLLV